MCRIKCLIIQGSEREAGAGPAEEESSGGQARPEDEQDVRLEGGGQACPEDEQDVRLLGGVQARPEDEQDVRLVEVRTNSWPTFEATDVQHILFCVFLPKEALEISDP